MAKKKASFSHIEARENLERFADSKSESTGISLLRIFAGYGDGQIARVHDGRGNIADDKDSILIKRLLAYKQLCAQASTDDLNNAIEDMLNDKKIKKAAPRIYAASNGEYIVAYDPKENDFYENNLSLLWKDFEFFLPLAGIEKLETTTEAVADVKSAELMSKIFDEIRRYNDIKDPNRIHSINVFMQRLLFCYFAEDTGLFPKENLFTNSIRRFTKPDGSDLAEFIDNVFIALSTNDKHIIENLPDIYRQFPYVNGGLFAQRLPIPSLSRRARQLMINCGEYAWAKINPDIFGSMIQAVVTPEKRAGLGIHYTSVPNILKLIRPLFLDRLTEEFHDAKSNRDAKRLNNLRIRLRNIRFFDPACGSGNFLVIAYKCIRQLEIEILKALLEAGSGTLGMTDISLDQFYGIEIDEYACDTAMLSLWLAEHQMNLIYEQSFNTHIDTLPLRRSGNIGCGNACRLDWNAVCPHNANDEVYIMGNPPYLGSKIQNPIQKEDSVCALAEIKDKKGLDYIANWFWKGAKYISGTRAKYAFVTTNSISQGEQVAMLWQPILNLGLTIDFARTSFIWSNNAKNKAAIICAIIGVEDPGMHRDETFTLKRLFLESQGIETRVKSINPYLTSGDSVIVKKTTKIPDGLPKAQFGCMPYDNGNLLLSEDEKDEILSSYPIAQRFIKPILGSLEFIRDEKRYCLWIDDSDLQDAIRINPISKRIEATKEFRLHKSKDGQELAARPHQFREHYVITSDSKDKIIIPAVSSERREYIPIGYIDKNTIISNSAFAVYDAEMWLFAILTSRMHNVWVRSIGGRLKSDYRYSATLCYNTFPFPRLTAVQKKELTERAQEIIDIRNENFDLALGVMYNPETMPARLLDAHRKLDTAVERCYRPEVFTSDEQRLSHLLRLYSRQSKKNTK